MQIRGVFPNCPIGDGIEVIDFIQTSINKFILLSNGRVLVSGKNDHGQLGLGHTEICINLTLLEGIFDNYKIIDMTTNGNSTLFLTDRGQVIACGVNNLFQLGIGDTPHQAKDVVMPTLLAGLLQNTFITKIILNQVQGSDRPHTTFLSRSGETFRCGYNDHARFGEKHFSLSRDPSLLDHNIVTADNRSLLAFASDQGKVFISKNKLCASSLRKQVAEIMHENINKLQSHFKFIYCMTASGKILGGTFNDKAQSTMKEIIFPEEIIDFVLDENQVIFLGKSGKVYANKTDDYTNQPAQIQGAVSNEKICQVIIIPKMRGLQDEQSVICLISQSGHVFQCNLSKDSTIHHEPQLVDNEATLISQRGQRMTKSQDFELACMRALAVVKKHPLRRFQKEILSNDRPQEITESGLKLSSGGQFSLFPPSSANYQLPAEKTAMQQTADDLEKTLLELFQLASENSENKILLENLKTLSVRIKKTAYSGDESSKSLSADEYIFVFSPPKLVLGHDSIVDKKILQVDALWKSLQSLLRAATDIARARRIQALIILHELKLFSPEQISLLNSVPLNNISQIKTALSILVTKGKQTHPNTLEVLSMISLSSQELACLFDHPDIAAELANAFVWMKKNKIEILPNMPILVSNPHCIKKLTQISWTRFVNAGDKDEHGRSIPRLITTEDENLVLQIFNSVMSDQPDLEVADMKIAETNFDGVNSITINIEDLQYALSLHNRLEAVYHEVDPQYHSHDIKRLTGYVQSSTEQVVIQSVEDIRELARLSKRVSDPEPRPTKQEQVNAIAKAAESYHLMIKLFGEERAEFLKKLDFFNFQKDIIAAVFLVKPANLSALSAVFRTLLRSGNFYGDVQRLLPIIETGNIEKLTQVAVGLVELGEKKIASETNIQKLFDDPAISAYLHGVHVYDGADKSKLMQQIFNTIVSFRNGNSQTNEAQLARLTP